ncbi:guanylate kinase [Desulfatirhabdium butyrativorans]|uniref:guanylate kinase n=1 Tax=Desulfatirhabdium butyrativorans TaxID=340467 RepID=UPI0003F76023|nr:guanylate kinase [Desulfatirhabdium butyrativorans]
MTESEHRKAGTEDRPHLFIVSAPSGAGKTTLCRAVLEAMPDLVYSVSYTTRAPRPGERDGIDYHFIDAERFKQAIQQSRWAEWAEVHGNFYGTSADLIEDALRRGQDVLLDIDVQGAQSISGRYPEHSITIFIRPPDMDALRRRLESRQTDSPAVIERRLRNAEQEMAQMHRYRHVIVNDVLEKAIGELIGVIRSYRSSDPAGGVTGVSR